MSWCPQRYRGMTAKNYRRTMDAIVALNETGEVSEFLAKKAAKYEWVRREAFPLLYPEPDVMSENFIRDMASWREHLVGVIHELRRIPVSVVPMARGPWRG